MTEAWYDSTRKSNPPAIIGLRPQPAPSCRILGSNDSWGRGRGCRGVQPWESESMRHPRVKRGEASRFAGVSDVSYQCGVARRSAKDQEGENDRSSARALTGVKVCTQLAPQLGSHASSKGGCRQPLASQKLARASMASMAQGQRDLVGGKSISVRSAGGPPFQPQTVGP